MQMSIGTPVPNIEIFPPVPSVRIREGGILVRSGTAGANHQVGLNFDWHF